MPDVIKHSDMIQLGETDTAAFILFGNALFGTMAFISMKYGRSGCIDLQRSCALFAGRVYACHQEAVRIGRVHDFEALPQSVTPWNRRSYESAGAIGVGQ
ncbi:hypothetical protein [Streptomyces mirabilis]|uniref:hypothetical protein n=1 Tax=Streptomyces mirabilis TaxID=68239 RepID=UPI0036ED74FF